MSEVTQSGKMLIAVLMIVTGAFDTLGQAFITQCIRPKTSSWWMKATNISTSSIPSCRYSAIEVGCSHVSGLISSFTSILSSQIQQP